MRTWISGLALFASLVTVTCESKDTLSAEALDEKLERYIALLEKKRDAIDKFLNENYSSLLQQETQRKTSPPFLH